jgi:hypothetical protein
MPRPKLERRARKSLTSRFTKLENDGRPLERKIVRLLFAGKELKQSLFRGRVGDKAEVLRTRCYGGGVGGVVAREVLFRRRSESPSDQVTAPAKEELDVGPPPPKARRVSAEPIAGHATRSPVCWTDRSIGRRRGGEL